MDTPNDIQWEQLIKQQDIIHSLTAKELFGFQVIDYPPAIIQSLLKHKSLNIPPEVEYDDLEVQKIAIPLLDLNNLEFTPLEAKTRLMVITTRNAIDRFIVDQVLDDLQLFELEYNDEDDSFIHELIESFKTKIWFNKKQPPASWILLNNQILNKWLSKYKNFQFGINIDYPKTVNSIEKVGKFFGYIDVFVDKTLSNDEMIIGHRDQHEPLHNGYVHLPVNWSIKQNHVMYNHVSYVTKELSNRYAKIKINFKQQEEILLNQTPLYDNYDNYDNAMKMFK